MLLPGLDGTEILFGPLLARLPAWIDPVVVTYPESGPNTYETLIDLVDRAIEPLADCAILGWSFGGPLALMAAARRPAQVSSVLLCASFVTAPRPHLARFRFVVSVPVVAAVRTARRLRYWIPGFAPVELRRAKAMTWKRVGARALAARARSALGVDARAALRQCGARVAYLASTRDQVIPRGKLEEMLLVTPEAEVAWVDGPHMALFTHADDCAAHIAGLLQRFDRVVIPA